MTNKIRGKALILNDYFGRTGSDADVAHLTTLFRQLNFEVVSSFFYFNV